MTTGWTLQRWISHQKAALDEAAAIDAVLSLVASYKPDPAWIHIASEQEIRAQFKGLDKNLPLYGVPYAVKDNIDVAGFATTVACPAYLYHPEQDAFVVSLLRKAGAIVVGKTNLDQFATGLVGTRSPYGKPACAFSKDHVSGGSSSGSAVVTAQGLVPFALGTDTAGSGRVPAALNNLIGLKPTLGLFSARGVVPACKDIDTSTILALNLSDTQFIYSLIARFDDSYAYARAEPITAVKTFGPRPLMAVPAEPKFFGDKANEELYKAALKRFNEVGVETVPVDFSILHELADLLYEGPWVGERYAAISEFIKDHGQDKMDETVYKIIKKAENFSAADAFSFEYKRRDLMLAIKKAYAQFDGFITPTCPLNPTMSQVAAEPVLVNSRQGTYTNFVNLGDMSALAVPSGFRPDGLPVGVTIMGRAFADVALMEVAERFLALSSERTMGATGLSVGQGDVLIKPDQPLNGYALSSATIPLAVVGAHLSGMSLNWQLLKVGAVLRTATTTAARYKLYALPNTTPPKPGLEKVAAGTGHKIAVEVWDVPTQSFGEFIAMVPAPLAIGTVELASGQTVKGFVCEQIGYTGATDVSHYGGWRQYVAATKPKSEPPFDTVLVANRGEVAVRLIRTLKRLGIKSVAIYSEPDRYTQHVKDADVAVPLHGSSAAETYLSIHKVLAAARQTGAQAILPGYGFLSENADFSQACRDQGFVFVGPSPESIRSLGLKHSARKIAEEAGVPLVPGSGLIEELDEALKVAERLGYPLMVKSTAGGGGIGLERVNSEAELRFAFHNVKHQGLAFFNDAGVFLERFVENARHVEVQVFGDGYGRGLSLGERDCSLQRRNQKVIEETPAPNFPETTRAKMRAAAEGLVSSMKYKNAGTVEFIYDGRRDEFYFLEVNARLQVEHPITENVTGLDLVEWMLYVAADRASDLFSQQVKVSGASMEARVYAENPVKGFVPSPGRITQVHFPRDPRIRVDTWIAQGTVVSSEYDPTLAKIIVRGETREEARQLLSRALAETRIGGVVTNLDYLRAITDSTMFQTAAVATKVLDSFAYSPAAFEVTAPGNYTTIQDYPGRTKLWNVGVPPSGPMDSYSFRVANRIVGNPEAAPGLECTLVGPSLVFHQDATIALCGGASAARVDDQEIALWKPVKVQAGQKLVIGKLTSGCRSYLAIRGGIDVPEYLGSRSTFAAGNMGGYNGRVLKVGDVLFLGTAGLAPVSEPAPAARSLIPSFENTWHVGVTCGPHGSPDFFTDADMKAFLAAEWKVHYNSNRFGVRLMGGPKPEWARRDGGEAGLHPSNQHDYVYSLGAINFTGDQPVILTCDGPSLGGFVCAVVVLDSEMWKIGQAKPGDKLRFYPVSFETAVQLKKNTDQRIAALDGTLPVIESHALAAPESPVLHSEANAVYRQAGDRYILVEFGDKMDINTAFLVKQFKDQGEGLDSVVEISPGVRSVLVEFDYLHFTQHEVVQTLIKLKAGLSTDSWKTPSRLVRLPMAFEDSRTLAAVERYKDTVRSEAPWLPNNVDFVASVNQVSRDVVRETLYSARFLCLGLGDVYLGSPCAVPLDPRHRLAGTKYNPSRVYTPTGVVGLGGMYMCIYAMDSPGGYQLMGRTIPIWDQLRLNDGMAQPWMFKQFDQIEFYPATEAEVDAFEEQFVNGRFELDIQDTVFDYGEYKQWLAANQASIDAHQAKQNSQDMVEVLRRIQEASTLPTESAAAPVDTNDWPESCELVYAEVVAGRYWKSVVEEGAVVAHGEGLVILEAMKTEMVVSAPVAGRVVKLLHSKGDMIETGDVVAVIDTA